MGLSYDEARRQAAAYIDALNSRDADALEAELHEKIAHQSLYTDRRLGEQDGHVHGKQAHREHMRWVWDQYPDRCHVLDDVFLGPHGYAFLTHRVHDGAHVIWVREVGADGLVRSQRMYVPQSAAG